VSGRDDLPSMPSSIPVDDQRSATTMWTDSIPEAAAKLVAARLDQGLTSDIEDLAVLVRIAAFLRLPQVAHDLSSPRGTRGSGAKR
jgi:hypothetical protein